MNKLRRTIALCLLAAAAGTVHARTVPADGDLTQLDLDTLMSMDVTLVTAQKRVENVQSVPISMSVLKSRDFESASFDSTWELQQVVPGLTTSAVQNFMVPFIRGVGTDALANVESSVSVYVDEVYQTERSQTLAYLSDVEHIEVLKGLQGTLYGRNTTGGAIKIATRGPTDRPAATLRVSSGNYDLRDASMFIAGPLHERVRASFSAHARRQDGYIKNTLGLKTPPNEDFHTVQGRIAVDLPSRLDAELLLKYLERDDGVNWPTEYSGRSLAALLGAQVATEPFTSAANEPDTRDHNVTRAAALKLNWKGSSFHLRSISAYRDVRYRSVYDMDASSAPLIAVTVDAPSHAFTQELLLTPAAADGRLSWLAGAFLMEGALENEPLRLSASCPDLSYSEMVLEGALETRAVATFGDLTYKIDERFLVTGGLRYSRERKALVDTRIALNGDGGTRFADQSHVWNAVSYRLIGKYSLERSMFYAKSETGMKTGTFNNFDPLNPHPTDPERLTAYEVGVKHALIDLPVRVSAALFYNDYRDQHVQLVSTGGAAPRFATVPRSRTRGIDLGVEMKAGRHWSVNAGLEWLDATYRRFASPAMLAANPLGGQSWGTDVDVRGNRLTRSPEITANLGVSFEYPFHRGALFGAANLYYSGRMYFDPANLYSQAPYELLNVRAGYRADAGWQISVWSKNLTDSAIVNDVIATPLGANARYAPPRTYGVTLEYSFGR